MTIKQRCGASQGGLRTYFTLVGMLHSTHFLKVDEEASILIDGYPGPIWEATSNIMA
jgi:hypothetical protein